MALEKTSAGLSDLDRRALLTWFLIKEDKDFGSLVREQDLLNTEAKAIARKGAMTLVMQEKADSEPSAIGDAENVADHVRCRVYRVS